MAEHAINWSQGVVIVVFWRDLEGGLVNEEPRTYIAPATDHKSEASGRNVLKRFVDVSPLFVSVIAVIISLFAYLDQRSTNETAQISAERAYAVNSSFWLVYKPLPPEVVKKIKASNLPPGTIGSVTTSPGSSNSIPGLIYVNENISVEVVVENRNSTPISDVDLVMDARRGVGQVLGSEAIGVGTVPPCSTATITTISRKTDDLSAKLMIYAIQRGVKYGDVTIDVTSMIFTDSNGIRWSRSQNGSLARYSGQISSPTSIEYPVNNDIKTASGCLSNRKRGGY